MYGFWTPPPSGCGTTGVEPTTPRRRHFGRTVHPPDHPHVAVAFAGPVASSHRRPRRPEVREGGAPAVQRADRVVEGDRDARGHPRGAAERPVGRDAPLGLAV